MCSSVENIDLVGTSLVVQWLRVHLPMQGMWVQFLVWELRSRMLWVEPKILKINKYGEHSTSWQCVPTLGDSCVTGLAPVTDPLAFLGLSQFHHFRLINTLFGH